MFEVIRGGCIVGPDLAVLHLAAHLKALRAQFLEKVMVKKGEEDIPGLTVSWRVPFIPYSFRKQV